MAIPGKIDVVVKINQLPTEIRTVDHEVQFVIDTGEQLVAVIVKSRVWERLVQADQNNVPWVAAIKGKMGIRTEKGFVLEQPAVQVFEKNNDAAKKVESNQ
jgi:hypothetical protein